MEDVLEEIKKIKKQNEEFAKKIEKIEKEREKLFEVIIPAAKLGKNASDVYSWGGMCSYDCNDACGCDSYCGYDSCYRDLF